MAGSPFVRVKIYHHPEKRFLVRVICMLVRLDFESFFFRDFCVFRG